MESERIRYINFTMDELHKSNTEIYELLIDRDFDELDGVLDALIIKLTELKESIQDE